MKKNKLTQSSEGMKKGLHLLGQSIPNLNQFSFSKVIMNNEQGMSNIESQKLHHSLFFHRNTSALVQYTIFKIMNDPLDKKITLTIIT